jgi:hypothetical protein
MMDKDEVCWQTEPELLVVAGPTPPVARTVAAEGRLGADRAGPHIQQTPREDTDRTEDTGCTGVDAGAVAGMVAVYAP